MAQSMQGKVAFVSGGGGGIGSAICQRLAREGARVLLTYRSSAEKAQAVLDSLEGSGHQMVQADATDSAAMLALAEQVKADFGRIDLLVNNAGVTTPVPHDDLHGLTDDWIDRIFATNWRGAFATIRAFEPLMSDGSTVVNISSIAGQTGVGSNVAYCASKAAMDSMTRSLARALAPKIRVVSVSPGWVLGEYAKRFPQSYIDEQTNATPLKRLASAENVADAVLAVHTALTFTTGTIISVDGGRPLGVS